MSPRSSAKPSTATAISSGYDQLAANLADPFLTDRAQQAKQRDLAQLLAEANVKVVRYQSLKTDDPLLRRIAQEAGEAGAAMVQSEQTLDAMRRDDGLYSILLGGLGIYTGDPAIVLSAAEDILNKGDAQHQEQIRWVSALNRSRAAQLMLPEAAKAYAGEVAATGSLVGVDIDESFAGSANYDAIALVNTSGRTLSHCTVLVELHGRDGDVRQNVHYLPTWDAGASRFARYGIGLQAEGGVYARRTVYGVQEAIVSVWADETRQEGTIYRYVGRERDQDVKTLLDSRLRVSARFEPRPMLRSGPLVTLRFSGVAELPAHRLLMTLHPKPTHGMEPTQLSWDQGPWYSNEQREFNLAGKVTFDAAAIDVAVTFPGIDYTFRQTVTFAAK